MKYIVSACLAGHHCRYDGGSTPEPRVMRLVEKGLAIPVCPETLARLPVPRPPCEQKEGRVLNRDGLDVTDAFQKGAEMALRKARDHGCTAAILKARSPSCGVGRIYDGTFSGTIIPGDGVWATLMKKSGFALYTEERMPPELSEHDSELRLSSPASEVVMQEKKSPLEALWDIRLAEVAGNLSGNGFAVDVFPTLQDAVNFFKDTLLPEVKPASVIVGGSATVIEGGVYDILANFPGLTFLNPYTPGFTPAESMECRRQGLLADMMVTSTNALIRDGRLLNLDGTGNRVAAMHFGPRKVVLFVGRNKICEDLEDARQHIKEIAAPANAIRLARKTPCTKTGTCSECQSPDRICSVWTLTDKSWPQGRIHVLLINQELGF